jgi:hypothetical protein
MEEHMVNIKENLKVVQEMQKSYVDKGITHREFKVGEKCIFKS